ncbi:MAG: SRPBCC family protein [Geminicoccaceae bacterium]
MAASASAASRTAERDLVISRVLEAPRDLVFEAWTEQEHLIHWSAPHGFTITHGEGDVRPGGAWRCCMRSAEGVDYWLGGSYREIVAPERLVFTHAWEDEADRTGHATLVTVTFAEHGQRTKLGFHQAGFESVASRDSHRDGWTECLDRLAGYLATA